MATVAELITMAEVQAEEAYEEPVWIQFINRCLDDLTPAAKMLKREIMAGKAITNRGFLFDLNGTDPDEVTMAGAHEIINAYYQVTDPALDEPKRQLRRLGIGDNLSMGYQITNDTLEVINLPEDVTEVTLIFDFHKKLEHVENTEDTPDLPIQYHDLIVLFMCSRTLQKEEELQSKTDYYGEYLMGKNAMALDRIWETEPQNRKFIRKARIAARIGVQG